MAIGEGDAMKIFLLLNGAALVFLVYVLVHFWKEARRTPVSVRNRLRGPSAGLTPNMTRILESVTPPSAQSALVLQFDKARRSLPQATLGTPQVRDERAAGTGGRFGRVS
jgi:hypothetical protein